MSFIERLALKWNFNSSEMSAQKAIPEFLKVWNALSVDVWLAETTYQVGQIVRQDASVNGKEFLRKITILDTKTSSLIFCILEIMGSSSKKREEDSYSEFLKSILETNPRILYSTDKNGKTPLHRLVFMYSQDSRDTRRIYKEKSLLKEIAALNALSVNKKDNKGKSPLHIAAEKYDIPLLETLISVKGDICLCDDQGNTPFHYLVRGWACSFEVQTGSSMQHIRGCDPKEIKTYETCYRSYAKILEFIEKMVEIKTDLTLSNHKKETPFKIALQTWLAGLEEGKLESARLFKAFGIDSKKHGKAIIEYCSGSFIKKKYYQMNPQAWVSLLDAEDNPLISAFLLQDEDFSKALISILSEESRSFYLYELNERYDTFSIQRWWKCLMNEVPLLSF